MMAQEDADYVNDTEYMDYGYLGEDKAGGYTQREALHIISVIIYSLAFTLGVIGNGMVIWVTAFKSKRTVNSVWLQNLAIADFVFVLFLPFSIDYVLRDFHWLFGKTMCKLNSFVCTMNMYASVLFLTVLSLDRYISLVHLNWSERYRNVRRSWWVCALIWITSCCLSSPALIFRDVVQHNGRVVCFNNFHEESRHVIAMRHIAMVSLRTTVGFLLPFATITVSGVMLAIKMRQSDSVRVSSFSRTVSAVILAFFLCWVPFHTFSLMELSMHHTIYLHSVLIVGFPLATSLAFFNSCVNPILYVLLTKKARKLIKTSCLKFTKSSLRELSQSVSATELDSALPSCSRDEPTANSSV
ncbi:G- coupled receptor 1-like protein [Labeo rohita]|uniref:G-coupled receptor 1-like protein n=2 Tax=Labeo rohita TaxID=84645 RepID=A0A498LFN4_LABRO|nr:chemerin-like receptor 2 [Labeo rohita]RXN07118.1 G- coupled receptor 1-like protein [Labeo rohita]RXN08212.1 G- coupled receptor 1-like protein [Labeo rohita]